MQLVCELVYITLTDCLYTGGYNLYEIYNQTAPQTAQEWGKQSYTYIWYRVAV